MNREILKKTMNEVKTEIREIFLKARALDPNVKIGSIYHEYSRQHGYKDWNTLSGMLKKHSIPGDNVSLPKMPRKASLCSKNQSSNN